MDAVVGLAAVGVASSGAAGYLVARLATIRHERLRRTWALAAEGGRGAAHPGLAWRLRHGVSGLRPVAEALLRREPVRRYVLWARMALEQRGYASTSDALLSLVLGACLALLVAGWVVAASPVFGAAVAGCALVALCAAVKSDAEQKGNAIQKGNTAQKGGEEQSEEDIDQLRYFVNLQEFELWKQEHMPDWDIMLEQMLVYFVFTYFCGAVYDGRIQAKMQVCVYSVYIIEEILRARWLENEKTLSMEEVVELTYRYSREVEHSDQNPERLEHFMEKNPWIRVKK